MNRNPLLREHHWNSTLPPVDVDVLVALNDGTVWKVHRKTWLRSYKDDPEYRCTTTGHAIDVEQVIGWRYV